MDSAHVCLSGYNEVVMLKRLSEDDKRQALEVLDQSSHFTNEALYGLPHDRDDSVSYCVIHSLLPHLLCSNPVQLPGVINWLANKRKCQNMESSRVGAGSIMSQLSQSLLSLMLTSWLLLYLQILSISIHLEAWANGSHQ